MTSHIAKNYVSKVKKINWITCSDTKSEEAVSPIGTCDRVAVHAWRHVRLHVRVSTHEQNPQHERKIARAKITINHTITHAKLQHW